MYMTFKSSSMELSLTSMLVLFIVIVLSYVTPYSLQLLNFWRRRKTTAASGGNKLYPPGSTGWPIIGEGLSYLNAGRNGVPEKFFMDRMRKYSTSDIFKTSLLGETVTVLCGAAGNKFLFSNEYKLVNTWYPPSIRKIFPSSSLTTGQQESLRLRKLFPQFLKPEALQRYVEVMDSMTKKHFETCWDHKKEVIVFPLVKNYTFSLACRLFLSIDDQVRVNELIKLFTIVAEGLITIPIDLPRTPMNCAIKASKLIREELVLMIKERKIQLSEKTASPTQDMLSHMILFSDENGIMNEMDIADKILGLLIGSHDTASATITIVMKYLAELPHIYNEVLREQTEIANSKAPKELLNWDDVQKMRYSWNVACEAMRLAPPLQGGFKQAVTDFTYAGYIIPKGGKLYWSTITTHKDPKYFPDPEKFDPSRFEGNGPAPYTFIPFSGGPRMCPGKEYARLEILVFMHNLVTRYEWEKLLPNDEKIIVNPLPLPAKGLPIRLQPRVMRA